MLTSASLSKSALALILSCTLFLSACNQVLADIGVAIETANSIGAAVGAVSPADAAIIQGLSATALLGLNTIKTTYDAYKASGASTDLQKLQAAIAAVQANLPAELAASHITDPNAVRIVTAWVGLIVTTLNAILAALPQFALVSGPKVALLAPLPTPKSLKARWANEVCLNDAACTALVK